MPDSAPQHTAWLSSLQQAQLPSRRFIRADTGEELPGFTRKAYRGGEKNYLINVRCLACALSTPRVSGKRTCAPLAPRTGSARTVRVLSNLPQIAAASPIRDDTQKHQGQI